MISKYQNYFFILPGALSLIAVIAIVTFGLKPGIDLSGGSLLHVSYMQDRPDAEDIRTAIEPLDYGQILVQPSGEKDYLLRQRALSPEEKKSLLEALGNKGEVQEVQFNSIGPSIGAELVRKAWVAVTLIAILIIAFIAFAFRKVSKPIASWKYGVVAIITLLHDILIPLGLFAYLGYIRGAELDALFIVALLTILGISINDTIVVFDRIRENLKENDDRNRHEAFKDVVSRSISQTITRSVNTSVTVIIVLLALFFLGPSATKDFALTLTVGMIAGTYSSIFLASPLLVVWDNWSRRNTV
ncbi:protein translocase subunit SecF [Candidatus Kaiserbacteria bacterium]|nr:protein translocase subunit SecF [Candidatus Kaiserbacteria bacterium]